MTEMLTAKDMQQILHVDRSTVYRMAEQGRLPAIKIGKQWRFPTAQVDQWLQNQTSSAPEPGPTPTANLADLLPLDCVQLIQDTFADTLDVMLVITDMAGRPITEFSNPCGLFETINQQPGAVQRCIDSWHTLANTLDLEPKLRPSHLGLLCARGVIRVGTELKGMVVAGGIAPEQWPPAPDDIFDIANEFGVTPNTIGPKLNEVYTLDPSQQAKVLTTIQRIADIIAHIIGERRTLTGQLAAMADLTVDTKEMLS